MDDQMEIHPALLLPAPFFIISKGRDKKQALCDVTTGGLSTKTPPPTAAFFLFCLHNTQKYPTKRQFWKVAVNRVLNTLFSGDHAMTTVF